MRTDDLLRAAIARGVETFMHHCTPIDIADQAVLIESVLSEIRGSMMGERFIDAAVERVGHEFSIEPYPPPLTEDECRQIVRTALGIGIIT